MTIICPRCHSSKIVKNGKTYYKKQNHLCNDCGRQFVLDNVHHKSPSLRKLVKKALKERLSLRAICRIFDLSLTWIAMAGGPTESRFVGGNDPKNKKLTSVWFTSG